LKSGAELLLKANKFVRSPATYRGCFSGYEKVWSSVLWIVFSLPISAFFLDYTFFTVSVWIYIEASFLF